MENKKSQLQSLCEEKIPALLRGGSPQEVFKSHEQIQQEKRIETPWAVYSFSGARASGVGLITKEVEGGSVFIQDYKDGSNEWWDPRYVQRFETPDEAATCYLKSISLPHKFKEVLSRLSKSFPEEFRLEKVKGLCRVLLVRADSLLAQSSPSCTEERIGNAVYSVVKLSPRALIGK